MDISTSADQAIPPLDGGPDTRGSRPPPKERWCTKLVLVLLHDVGVLVALAVTVAIAFALITAVAESRFAIAVFDGITSWFESLAWRWQS